MKKYDYAGNLLKFLRAKDIIRFRVLMVKRLMTIDTALGGIKLIQLNNEDLLAEYENRFKEGSIEQHYSNFISGLCFWALQSEGNQYWYNLNQEWKEVLNKKTEIVEEHNGCKSIW